MDPFDDGYVLWALVAGVLGVMAMMAWWVLVVWYVSRRFDAAFRSIDRLLPSLERQLRRFGSLPDAERRRVEPAIVVQLGQLHARLKSLDETHRRRYMRRVVALRRMASRAGFAWPRLLFESSRSRETPAIPSAVTG